MLASTLKPLCVQSSMFFASRSFRSLRSRKNAITLWRKQQLIFWRSAVGLPQDFALLPPKGT